MEASVIQQTLENLQNGGSTQKWLLVEPHPFRENPYWNPQLSEWTCGVSGVQAIERIRRMRSRLEIVRTDQAREQVIQPGSRAEDTSENVSERSWYFLSSMTFSELLSVEYA